MNDFKPGDIICGIANNGYSVTNEKMKKAEVLKIYDSSMQIKILSHEDKEEIGATSYVENTSSKFKKYISKELHITTDGYKTYGILKENGKVIKRTVVRCHPNDTFDFKIGADTVINRIFHKEEPIKKETKKILVLEAEGKELGVLGEEIDKTDSWGQPLHVGDIVEYYSLNGQGNNSEIRKVGQAVVISKEDLIILYKNPGFLNNLPIGLHVSHKVIKRGFKYFNTEIRIKEKEIEQ